MNWKKAIAFLLLLGLMPGLVGCGGENAPQTDESMETKAAEATAPTVLKLEPELEPGTEPTPEPTMEPPVPEIIDESWCDDAIFVGDSITGMLSSYTLLNGGLGDALVVYANSYSCHNAVEDGVKLSYQGEKLSMAELVEKSGAEKAFFLLSMNDLSRTPEQVVDCWETVLEDIRSRCPDTQVFIQSGTPLFTETDYLNNENVELLNEALMEFCLENGCIYVDIAQGLKDEEGNMQGKFSLDYAHFNGEGCKVWIEALMDRDNYYYSPDAGTEEET